MSVLCHFRFYESLTDFLKRYAIQPVRYDLRSPTTVKDAIEAIGIPHVEVGAIVVNNVHRDFLYLLQPGDSIDVYPHQTITSPTPPKFVLDVHLGKLARLLRLLGMDCFYKNDLPDKEIINIAVSQNRAVLTRDIGLLKHKILRSGYWLRSQQPEVQLEEVIRHFDLCFVLQPFSRCLSCNGKLDPVSKEEVLPDVLPQTRESFTEFYRCLSCMKIYWKGSHYERMWQLVERVRSMVCQHPPAADIVP